MINVTNKRLFLPILLLTIAFLLAACGSSLAEPAASEAQGDADHDEDMDHEHDMDHDEDMDYEHDMDHDEDMDYEHDMDHDEDMDHEHDDGDASSNRIPNEGNSIQILEPANNATFANGEDIFVAVEFEDFAYGEDGSHWHIYIDGSSYGMVMGLVTNETVRGLEPGEYEILVVMANGDHIEFEDGDSIMITVEE